MLAVVGQNGNALAAGPINGYSELADPSNNLSFAACYQTTAQNAQNTQWTPNTFAGMYAAGIAGYIIKPTPSTTPSATPTAAPTPGLNPAYVQQAGTTSLSGTSIAPAFGTNVTVGDTVALFVNSIGGSAAPTVSGLGATWTPLASYTSAFGYPQSFIYVGIANSTGQTVTVSGLANQPTTAQMGEFTNMPSSVTQDGSAATGTGRGTHSLVPAIEVNSAYSSANAFDIILCTAGVNTNTISGSNPGSPWANLSAQAISGQMSAGASYQIVSSTGAFQPIYGTTPNGFTYAATCVGLEY
jgi:hypothetical protein